MDIHPWIVTSVGMDSAPSESVGVNRREGILGFVPMKEKEVEGGVVVFDGWEVGVCLEWGEGVCA